MLNALYYVPMQFVGFFVWNRHMNQETCEVEMGEGGKEEKCGITLECTVVLLIRFILGIFQTLSKPLLYVRNYM